MSRRVLTFAAHQVKGAAADGNRHVRSNRRVPVNHTQVCTGTVRNADLPLPDDLRAEVVRLMAEALIADFIGANGGDGSYPSGDAPYDAEHVGHRHVGQAGDGRAV